MDVAGIDQLGAKAYPPIGLQDRREPLHGGLAEQGAPAVNVDEERDRRASGGGLNVLQGVNGHCVEGHGRIPPAGGQFPFRDLDGNGDSLFAITSHQDAAGLDCQPVHG
jgi:hypothetical protein